MTPQILLYRNKFTVQKHKVTMKVLKKLEYSLHSQLYKEITFNFLSHNEKKFFHGQRNMKSEICSDIIIYIGG